MALTTAQRLTALETQVENLNVSTVALLAEITRNNDMLSQAIANMASRIGTEQSSNP